MVNFKLGKFSLRASIPDDRDYIHKAGQDNLRQVVDLREWASPVQDQLDLGSCVAVAITDSYELGVNRLYPDTSVDLSKLFVYYNARLLDHTVDRDDGTTIRNAIKGCSMFGLCSEELWPYNSDNFAKRPSPLCYRDASYRVVPKYEKLQDLHALLNAVNHNYSVVIGTTVYADFMYLSSDNYLLQQPKYNEKELGFHAMSIVGYDIDQQILTAKNSFGKNWGLDGYCQIPFHYAQTQFFEHWRFDIATPEVTSL